MRNFRYLRTVPLYFMIVITKIVKIVKIDLEMSQKNKSKFFISNRFYVSYCHLNKDPCFLDTLNVETLNFFRYFKFKFSNKDRLLLNTPASSSSRCLNTILM